MVEGPGCTNNGRKARSHVGRRVLGVNGQEAGKVAAAVRQRTLLEVLTLGKELWLLFGPPDLDPDPSCVAAAEYSSAVRLHFGMNGSLHVDSSAPRYPGSSLTLGVIFGGGHQLRVFQSTASIEPSVEAVLGKHQEGSCRDVCSEELLFDPQECVAAMAAQAPSSLICDVVLDQAVLPGSGNIIKNEGLHRAGVHPLRKVGSLSAAELLEVVTQIRKYSLEWRRAGRAPAKQVYNRTQCAACGGRVLLQKAGGMGHLQRVTFWCEACQGSRPGLQGEGTARAVNIQDGQMLAGPAPAAMQPLPAATISCPAHGSRSTALKRTRKQGVNLGRLFFTCQAAGCNFFKWADVGFPRCNCTPSRTAQGMQTSLSCSLASASSASSSRPVSVLRVSKKESSGGRWFFSCREGFGSEGGGARGAPGGKSCNFFAWATPAQLAPLGDLLTPLS